MKIREIMQDSQRAPLFLVSCGMAALSVAVTVALSCGARSSAALDGLITSYPFGFPYQNCAVVDDQLTMQLRCNFIYQL